MDKTVISHSSSTCPGPTIDAWLLWLADAEADLMPRRGRGCRAVTSCRPGAPDPAFGGPEGYGLGRVDEPPERVAAYLAALWQRAEQARAELTTWSQQNRGSAAGAG